MSRHADLSACVPAELHTLLLAPDHAGSAGTRSFSESCALPPYYFGTLLLGEGTSRAGAAPEERWCRPWAPITSVEP